MAFLIYTWRTLFKTFCSLSNNSLYLKTQSYGIDTLCKISNKTHNPHSNNNSCNSDHFLSNSITALLRRTQAAHLSSFLQNNRNVIFLNTEQQNRKLSMLPFVFNSTSEMDLDIQKCSNYSEISQQCTYSITSNVHFQYLLSSVYRKSCQKPIWCLQLNFNTNYVPHSLFTKWLKPGNI